MTRLLQTLTEETRTAATVGLLAGLAVGAALGVALVSIDFADLLFFTLAERAVTVVTLAAGVALASSAGLALLAVAVTLARWLGVPVSKPIGARFYLVSYGMGGLFVHGFLRLAYSYQRDVFAPRGILWIAILAGTALGLHLLAWKLWNRIGRAPRWSPGGRWLAAGVPLLAVLAVAGTTYLRAADDSTRPVAEPPLVMPTHSAERPELHNVLLISIDTLRADHLSAYGYSRPTSPRLDALARCGTRFANARTTSPWTLPSHASMLTSLYPPSHGARFRENSLFLPYAVVDPLVEDHLTLAEILRAAGFRTAAFTANVFVSRELGFAQGFDRFENERQPTAGEIVSRAIEWLETPSERPFFLFLHFIDVHDYQAPEDFLELYARPDYRGRIERRDFALHPVVANLYEDLAPDDLEYLIARYDGAIRYVDDRLGGLFERLRELDLFEQTTVVVTSDHGEEFWEHGGTGHGYTLYEEQLRIPLIVKPATSEGCPPASGTRVVTDAVSLVDVLPTVLDGLGLPVPGVAEGLSLLPLIDGGTLPDRPLFAGSTSFFHNEAVIDGEVKLISNRVPPRRLLDPAFLVANVRTFYKFRDDELYHLASDAGERADRLVLEAEVEAETVGRLREELRAHLRSAGEGPAVGLDEEMVERLRALGYIP